MISVEGAEILTIEGIKDSKEYAVIRDAMEKAGVVQCGFCTPGMVLAIYTYFKMVVSRMILTSKSISQVISVDTQATI